MHALYAEVGRREARLAELGAKKVTRPLAEKHLDLRPLVALFSECHELFGIRFEGHPDLRNLLLADGWEGYPLRKDYAVDTPHPPYR